MDDIPVPVRQRCPRLLDQVRLAIEDEDAALLPEMVEDIEQRLALS